MFLILFCGLKLLVACVRLPPCVSIVLQAGILFSARHSAHMRRRLACDLKPNLAETALLFCRVTDQAFYGSNFLIVYTMQSKTGGVEGLGTTLGMQL